MASVEKQIIYVFNKFTKSFINEIKKDDSLKKILKKNYLCFDKNTDEYIELFRSNLSDQIVADQVSGYFQIGDINHDVIHNIYMLKDIQAKDISYESTKQYYLYVFYTLVRLYNDVLTAGEDDRLKSSYKTILVSILKVLNSTYDPNEVLDEIFDDEYKTLLCRIKDLKTETNQPAPNIDAPPFNMDAMNNTKIGKLAQEISSQIDMKQFENMNADNINDLFSGENSAMANIIGQVSSVMSTKMKNGELNQEELMNEAFAMMGNMKQDDVLKNMMASMNT